MDRQEYVEAASVFRRLTHQSPGDPGLRNSLAMALVMSGSRQEARAELEEAVRLAPREIVFQLNLGKYHILMEDFGRGRQVLEKLLPLATPEVRDEILGYLNQCLANLGLPLASAGSPPAMSAESLATPPAVHTGHHASAALAATAAGAASEAHVAKAAPVRDMLLCCGQGLDSFVSNLISGLAPQVRVEKLVSDRGQDFLEAMARHQTVWIEWGNELAEFLTKQGAQALKGKRVILRIHAYEVMQGLADRIDYNQISDLMFVCAGMRDLLLQRRPEIRQQVKRIHVIPNGIDTARFTLAQRPPGLELAYVGYLNFKKGPMELMHAMEVLHRRHGRCRLHVAGVFQDLYSETACRHFIARNNLEGAVHFYGWVKDVKAWLADKTAIICTSLSESQGLGLMEAMAMGLKPLIYNFHTAEHIYPRRWLWNNFDELTEMLHEAHDPQEVRRFVEQNYSLDLQLLRLKQMLSGDSEVIFERVESNGPQLPLIPAECYATSLAKRQQANFNFGQRLLQNGHLKPARVFFERAWTQSEYQDRAALNSLIGVHEQYEDYNELTQVHKERGFAAARRGDFETMLQAFYSAYYAAYVRTSSYYWQEFDPGVDTVLRLVADKIKPLDGHQDIIQRIAQNKRKLVLALDSLDPQWATVKRFVEVAKRINKDIFSVIILVLRPEMPSWQAVIAELNRYGCHTACSQGDKLLPNVQRGLHLLKQIGCDYFVSNTPFVTPHLDLLAHCRPAKWNIKFVSQGGGMETSIDRAWTTVRELLIDEVRDGFFIGPAFVVPPVPRALTRSRREGELKAVCVGRAIKFIDNQQFWRILLEVLSRLPGLSLDIIGCGAHEIFPGGSLPHPRLKFLGFRDDVVELLSDHDVLIDTWPLGGGSTLREALGVGIPVVSVKAQQYEHYDSRATYHVGCNEMIHPDLLLPEMNADNLSKVLAMLAGDLEYYQRITTELAEVKMLGPDEVARSLENHLLSLDGSQL
jgi:glycosyltransferase involved in cell wall biosynthesis